MFSPHQTEKILLVGKNLDSKEPQTIILKVKLTKLLLKLRALSTLLLLNGCNGLSGKSQSKSSACVATLVNRDPLPKRSPGYLGGRLVFEKSDGSRLKSCNGHLFPGSLVGGKMGFKLGTARHCLPKDVKQTRWLGEYNGMPMEVLVKDEVDVFLNGKNAHLQIQLPFLKAALEFNTKAFGESSFYRSLGVNFSDFNAENKVREEEALQERKEKLIQFSSLDMVWSDVSLENITPGSVENLEHWKRSALDAWAQVPEETKSGTMHFFEKNTQFYKHFFLFNSSKLIASVGDCKEHCELIKQASQWLKAIRVQMGIDADSAVSQAWESYSTALSQWNSQLVQQIQKNRTKSITLSTFSILQKENESPMESLNEYAFSELGSAIATISLPFVQIQSKSLRDVFTFFPADSGSLVLAEQWIPLMVANRKEGNLISGGYPVIVTPQKSNKGSSQSSNPSDKSSSDKPTKPQDVSKDSNPSSPTDNKPRESQNTVVVSSSACE